MSFIRTTPEPIALKSLRERLAEEQANLNAARRKFEEQKRWLEAVEATAAASIPDLERAIRTLEAAA